MPPTNDIVEFCSTDTGTNLEAQATYVSDPNRLIGNQPGVASSKFVNKAARQAAYIASILAQYLVNQTGDDVLDDANAAAVLLTMNKAFRKAPTITKFLSGSGTYNPPAHVAFFKVKMVGGGAGGSGGTVPDGVAGGDTTFGAGLLVANGGTNSGPGSFSLGAAIGFGITGSFGSRAPANATGGNGGNTPLGGGGWGSVAGGTAAQTPSANSGGGGGGSNSTGVGNALGGCSGGYLEAVVAVIASYPYAVGAGGAAGATATVGTPGAAGMIVIEEYYGS